MLTPEDTQTLDRLIEDALRHKEAYAASGSGNREFERSRARFEALEDVREALDPTQARQRVAYIVRSIFKLRVPFGSLPFPDKNESESLCFKEDFQEGPESVKFFELFYHHEILQTLHGTKLEIIQKFKDWLKSRDKSSSTS